MSEEQKIKPGTVPARTSADLLKVADHLLQLRGEGPYTVEHYAQIPITPGELDLINDFMIHWRPFLVRTQ